MPKRAREPVDETAAATLAKQWGLDARLVSRLRALQVAEFFEVQRLVLPRVIAVADAARSSAPCRDICVSAPTGSGKTLVFVLGVLHGLAGGAARVRRLRALAVLPSRDLAMQVHAEFNRFAPAVGVRVGLAVGATSLAVEQRALVGTHAAITTADGGAGCGALLRALRAGVRARAPSCRAAATAEAAFEHDAADSDAEDADSSDADADGSDSEDVPAGGLSRVDVLVCTPGRLVEHLEGTPGFTLQHVRFLVVDEADRLLSQAYQDWLNKAWSARRRGPSPYTRERDCPPHAPPPPPAPAPYMARCQRRFTRPRSSQRRLLRRARLAAALTQPSATRDSI